jgi:hypothetical protein
MSAAAGSPQSMRPRQELAVRRFTQYCKDDWWGRILFHKVGTGKTITSLLIALNSNVGDKKIIIVSPSKGIFMNFVKDFQEKLKGWSEGAPPAVTLDTLVSYTYEELINDINNRNWRHKDIMSGSIWIFDEAHRMLGKEVLNSREAGSRTERHPILEDIFFVNKMKAARKCIVMTGTPIQVDVADICRLLNFVTQSDEFRADVFAPAQFQATALQWALVMFQNFLKATGVVISTLTLKAGTEQVTEKLTPYLPQDIDYGSWLRSMGLMLGILATSMLYLELQKVRGKQKPFKGGATRKTQRGGQGNSLLSEVTTVLGKQLMPGSLLALTAGPSGPGKPLYETLSKFGGDTLVNVFQLLAEDLYMNHWDIQFLAKSASPYVSIYDPDIQLKLKSEEGLYNVPKLGAAVGTVRNETGMKSFLQSFVDTSVLLDMPLKVVERKAITYTPQQRNLLIEMFAGEMRYETAAFFNLDRYQARNPDPKATYRFVRGFGRMIGNFSTDMLQYYTSINAAGTDYELYSRETGEEVVLKEDGMQPIFSCPKFEQCLNELVTMRKNGTMPDGTTAQPHLDGPNQYLPLVYSYTEDYGLGPFCIFLKTKGYKYILAHTKQAADILVETVDKGKSKGNPLFPPITDSDKNSPLCVLIHPSMTEGYDFVYNPAIFVLEPCNTFGDQEQVYGRVLRSYSGDDVRSFTDRKKKLIVQYMCLTEGDNNSISTKIQILGKKLQVSEARMILAPQQIFTAFQKGSIISPDEFAIERLKKEEKYLKEFEMKVKGGANFSDLIESLDCLKKTPSEVTSCDPMGPVPCARGGRRRWRTRKNK